MSFSADDAKRITTSYFTEAQKNSGEWITDQIELITTKVKDRASKGIEECTHEVDMDMDPLRIARTKFLLHELIKLQFKVGVEEKRNHVHRLQTTFHISWSAPETPSV
jgi:hypothetical protein